MASDFAFALKLTIDAPIALLHSAWIPGHVEVKQIRAIVLKINSFPCCIGRNQNSQRMLGRIAIERLFDELPSLFTHAPVKGINAI